MFLKIKLLNSYKTRFQKKSVTKKENALEMKNFVGECQKCINEDRLIPHKRD